MESGKNMFKNITVIEKKAKAIFTIAGAMMFSSKKSCIDTIRKFLRNERDIIRLKLKIVIMTRE